MIDFREIYNFDSPKLVKQLRKMTNVP